MDPNSFHFTPNASDINGVNYALNGLSLRNMQPQNNSMSMHYINRGQSYNSLQNLADDQSKLVQGPVAFTENFDGMNQGFRTKPNFSSPLRQDNIRNRDPNSLLSPNFNLQNAPNSGVRSLSSLQYPYPNHLNKSSSVASTNSEYSSIINAGYRRPLTGGRMDFVPSFSATNSSNYQPSSTSIPQSLSNPHSNVFSGSIYYNTEQLEKNQKLQISGYLKTSPWLIAPPVPEGTADHLRTGRVHEYKSRATRGKLTNPAYMDPELKQALHRKLKSCLFAPSSDIKDLPSTLGQYTDLVPLEEASSEENRVSATFGLPTRCFKAYSPKFGRYMLLRRLYLPHNSGLSESGLRLTNELSHSDHPSLVALRDVFFTNTFDDCSAIVVHEYCPCANTLQQQHMTDPVKLTGFSSPFNSDQSARPHSAVKNELADFGMLQESLVWSYLVQLTHGLRYIHKQLNRACYVLDPTKVLLQEGTRLRINCFGVKDILFPDDVTDIAEHQSADFVCLGKLLVGVACGTAAAIQQNHRSTLFNVIERMYSAELSDLLQNLLTGQVKKIDELVQATAPHVYDHLTRVYTHSDFLERQLFMSMECDRILRFVCKLQSIVERDVTIDNDPNWAESGDRHMLKLFRDFLFHQTDHLGAPYLDLSHIITVVNKVESSSPDRLCLTSRDSQTVVIVTYADVRRWLTASFNRLVERHRESQLMIQQHQQQQVLHGFDSV